MKLITLARRALSVLAIHSTLFQAAAAMDFEIRNEAEFKKLFPANATVTKLADGFGFTEGPVWIPRDGGSLFSATSPIIN